jgi:heparin/heparan-sulfate lyase
VVYDRVTSVQPDQQKVWLWHTQNEPAALAPGLFRTASQEGAMLVQTLLPEAANHEVIGGPGKEYWTNGRNWEIPDHEKRLGLPDNQYGRYRLEVSPAGDGEKTRFLHLLQVGPESLPATVSAKLVQTDAQDGMELDCPAQQRRFQVLFNRDGLIGGQIKVWNAAGELLLDQPLLQPVEPVVP